MLLRTLGELRLDGVEAVVSSPRKAWTLVAFVARRWPRGCTRDELSSLLWEDRDRSRARQSLRQELLGLKRALGDALLIEGEQVSIDPRHLTLDITAVERDLESGRLAQAVEAWRGDFLPGMEEIGGESLRAWLEGEREALRRRIRAAFSRLTGDAARAAAWSSAAEWAERWASAFPLDEDAHLQLVDALRLSGRQAAAASRLAAYTARIHVELGAAPSPAVQALRSSLECPGVVARRSPSLGSSALFSPDMVGRAPALAELAAAWSEVKAGATVSVIIEAESGLGKTRLGEEFLRGVRQAGDGVVLSAKGRRMGGSDSWRCVGELLAGITSAGGVAGASPDALSAVGTVVPALAARFPGSTAHDSRFHSSTAQDARAGADLGAALADVLTAVADERAIVLFLDDITRIDAPSLQMITGAVAAGVRRLLFIGTTATDDPATPAAVDALRPVGTLRRLKLQPLSVGDLEALLDSMLHLTPVDRGRLAARLHDEGGGSPFYAVEMTSALVDEGLLEATDDGAWRLTPLENWSPPRPASIREALIRRLYHLSRPARDMAEAAAATSGEITRTSLRRKSGLGTDAFEDALEELVAAKIIRPGTGDRLGFTQDMAAGVVSGLTTPERRKALGTAGEQPARRRHWWIAAAVALAAGAGVVAVRATARPPVDHRLALAAPLLNQTGDAGLDAIGDLAADWITQGIALSGVIHVVAPQTLRASLQTLGAKGAAPGSDAWLKALAKETAAGTVIGGAYYRAGDSLVFQLRITDAASGRVLSAPAPILGAATDPSRALEQLRERTVAALGLLFNARLTGMNQNASQPPAYAAYKEFVEGLDLHVAYRYAEALQKYRNAAALDSTFGSPIVWSALAYWTLDDFPRCDSMLRIAERMGDRLSPFDALLAANQRGELHGDYNAALAAAREMTRVTSGSEGYILVGQEALRLNRPREAVEAFSRADPDRGWIKGWEGYWGHLAMAYHSSGELEEALRIAREGHRRYPSTPYGLYYEAVALAALGRTAELEAVIEEAVSRPVNPDWPPSATMYEAAVELRAHGHAEAAREMALRGMRNRLAIAGPSSHYAPALDIYLAWQAEQWDQVERLARALAADSLRDPTGDGFLGLLAARRGDSTEAMRRATTLAGRTYAYDFGATFVWRARIAALLGHRPEAVQLLRDGFSHGARRDRLDHDAGLESLRGYPPFAALVRPVE